MRRILLFVIVFSFPGVFLIWGETGEPLITILYTSSLNGNLDGCTCKANPRAGLVKRAFFLKNQVNREKTILLDAGDILDVMPDSLLAQYIFGAYKELGYDAVALGDQEFLNGIDTLLGYKSGFPLISHNLYVCPTRESCKIFSVQPMVIKRRGIKVGIFSILDPRLIRFLEKKVQDKIKVKDSLLMAFNMVQLIGDYEVDMIILLYHGYYENALNLVREVDGIDLVVLGHEQHLLDLVKEGDTYIVSPGKEGNRLGMLEVYPHSDGGYAFVNSFKVFDYYQDPDDESTRKKIKEYYKQMMVE